jgi:hypothetical protein
MRDLRQTRFFDNPCTEFVMGSLDPVNRSNGCAANDVLTLNKVSTLAQRSWPEFG